MKQKSIVALIWLNLLILGIFVPALGTASDIESSHQVSTVYDFSISYSNGNSKFNTKSALNITYLQNGSEFFTEGTSIWHLPVNITSAEIRDLLAICFPTPFTNYLDSHLKNESINIPYQQRLLSNSSSGYIPAQNNLFLLKNAQNQTLQLNDSISLLAVSQVASGTIKEIKQVGFASWSSEPLSLAFAHSFVTATAVELNKSLGHLTIEMKLLYEAESGILISAKIKIYSENGTQQFSNDIKLIDSTIELKQDPNPNIYLYFAITTVVPSIVSILVIISLYKRALKRKNIMR